MTRSAILGLAAAGLVCMSITGDAFAQSETSKLLLAKPTGSAAAVRPLTLPESDEFLIPEISPMRAKALAAEQTKYLRNRHGDGKRSNSKPDSNEKIVGGEKASPGAYPFQVGLISVKTTKDGKVSINPGCGGSLLTSTWVLTAAHCFIEGDKGKVTSRNDGSAMLAHIGNNNLFGKADRIKIKRVITHPKYVTGTHVNDIALVELERAPASGAQAQRVTVVTKETEAETLPVGAELTIIGWGTTSAGGSPSADLLATTLTAVDRNACNRALTLHKLNNDPKMAEKFGDIAFDFNLSATSRRAIEQNIIQTGGMVTPQMICAATPAGGRDTCQGDSGGPILRKSANGDIVQVGVVSWGFGCGIKGLPGAYTRLSLYTEWMQQTISNPPPMPDAPKSSAPKGSSEKKS